MTSLCVALLLTVCCPFRSYAVALGLVDSLGRHIDNVRGPVDNNGGREGQSSPADDFLLAGLKFLTSLVELLQFVSHISSQPGKRKNSTGSSKTCPAITATDNTGLIEAFEATELAGVVNALYALLLHQSVQPSGGGRPVHPPLLESTVRFTLAALQLMHRLALLDLKSFQV